jgi:hypothetical protein
MRKPLHGCQHVGTIAYTNAAAECSRCGAVWWRRDDGPWKLVAAGSEPDAIEAFACDGCGAQYREAPRTCFVCGRPSRGDAALERFSTTVVAEILDRPALERIAAGVDPVPRYTPTRAPLGEVDDGLRAD